MPEPPTTSSLPHRIAVLCYLYDPEGRLLLLHRRKAPNAGMYSPVGGKLETRTGEGPHACAQREIREETGIQVVVADLRLSGIVSEKGYEGDGHWLIFLFEVTRPVEHDAVTEMEIDEGVLGWHDPLEVPGLELPETDRRIMWPLVCAHRDGFFMVHIDCTGDVLQWEVLASSGGE